jgi:hypothetical protein
MAVLGISCVERSGSVIREEENYLFILLISNGRVVDVCSGTAYCLFLLHLRNTGCGTETDDCKNNNSSTVLTELQKYYLKVYNKAY